MEGFDLQILGKWRVKYLGCLAIIHYSEDGKKTAVFFNGRNSLTLYNNLLLLTIDLILF